MREVVLSVVLLTLTVAGCIAGPAPEASQEQDWPTIENPRNLSYATDSGMHVHDYWDGQDHLEVMNDTKGKTHWYPALPGGEEASFSFQFRPPDGQVVPQGAAFLEVTVSWEDREPGTSYGRLSLRAKPANVNEMELIEEDLDHGGTVEIPLDYEEADLPHQLISNWAFEVQIHGSDDPYNRWVGSVTVQVEAHRGLELKPFPPHPDHWGDRTELPLVEETREFERYNYPLLPAYAKGNELDPVRPPNGSLVPSDAQRVEVTVTYDNDLPAGDVILYYHGADTRYYTQLEPDETEEGAKHYVIPVNETVADTPYADASQWAFVVNAPRDVDQGVTVFDGTYTLNATVHKE